MIPLKTEFLSWINALKSYTASDYESALCLFYKMDPHSKIYYNIGTIQMKIGNLDVAVQSFTEAVKCDEFFSLAYFQLGNCFCMLRMYKKAIEMYEKTKQTMIDSFVDYRQIGLDFVLRSSCVKTNYELLLYNLVTKDGSYLGLNLEKNLIKCPDLLFYPKNAKMATEKIDFLGNSAVLKEDGSISRAWNSPKKRQAMITIKCHLNTECRILSISSDDLNFHTLLDRLEKKFGSSLIVKYKDEDEDLILICDESDLEMALGNRSKLEIYCIKK